MANAGDKKADYELSLYKEKEAHVGLNRKRKRTSRHVSICRSQQS